jgi:hypothetical protein
MDGVLVLCDEDIQITQAAAAIRLGCLHAEPFARTAGSGTGS